MRATKLLGSAFKYLILLLFSWTAGAAELDCLLNTRKIQGGEFDYFPALKIMVDPYTPYCHTWNPFDSGWTFCLQQVSTGDLENPEGLFAFSIRKDDTNLYVATFRGSRETQGFYVNREQGLTVNWYCAFYLP